MMTVRLRRFVCWLAADSVRIWRAVFFAAMVAAMIWMLDAPKPWSVGVEPGESPRLRDFVHVWAWWALLFNIGLMLFLAWICPWWVRSRARPVTPDPAAPRWFRPLVLIALLVLVGGALQRMDHSFWVDEDFSVRDVIAGHYRVLDDGELQYRPRQWRHTLYEYELPNNHVFFSVCSRICLDVWRSIARPDGLPYTEWPMRVPSLLAGMGALLALAWTLRLFGMPGAGVLAAFLAALHPWFIRFSSEARGFAFVLLFIPLLIVAWRNAVRTGGWRWWALYAFSQFGLLYVFPAAVYVLLVLNIAAVCYFLSPGELPQPRRVLWSRWFLANCVAAGGVIQLMFPLVPQMQHYLTLSIAQGGMPLRWVINFLSHIFAGVPWSYTREEISNYPELMAEVARHPVFGWSVLAVGTLLMVIGFIRLLCSGRMGVIAALVFLLPAPLAYGVAVWQGQYLFDRYLMPLLPGALVFAATGLAGVAGWLRFGPVKNVLPPLAAGAALAVYAVFTQNGRHITINRSYNPIRESVLLTLPSLDPMDPRRKDVLTASFSFEPFVYDPWAVRVRDVAGLIEVMREADRRDVPLFVNIGNPWSAETFTPELFALFMDPELFEDHQRLLGFESTVDRMVARYRPGAVEKINAGAD